MKSAYNSPGQPVVARAFQSLKFVFIGVGLLSMLINVLMLTGPIFMLQVYDRVLASHSVPTLVVLGSLALFFYLFFGVLDGLRSRVLMRIGQLIDLRLSALSYEVSTRAPLLLGAKAGKLRPIQDLDTVRGFLCGQGPAAIMDMPWLPFYLVIVFLFHPLLGFVALGGTVVVCILIGLNELFSRNPVTESAKEQGRRSALVEASRNNAEVIQAMGMMETFVHLWNKNNISHLNSQLLAADLGNLFSTAIKTFRFLLQSTILGVGAWLAIKQEVTPGVMIATSILSSRALAPIEQAVTHWRGFVAARQSLSRLKDVLEARPDDSEMLDLPLPGKSVKLENFACGFVGSRQPFVKNISFELSAGSGLGIIGPSGSGKSTLARGIVGVVATLKGSVRFDGADINQWASGKIGHFVGYLPQDVQLFEGTIGDNISRFCADAESADIFKAAKLAGVHELIVRFPEGYNTVIGTTGLSLSGGQRQRIALARALYNQPFLIVLDEPNSNLDAEGETALAEAIRTVRDMGSIVIVIAHRPSAISAIDTILCMKDGLATVIGPKNEVMKQIVSTVPARGMA